MIKGLNSKGKDIRAKTILELREKKYWTLEKIGNEYGLSRERVRQIINNQLNKGRKYKP